ncbi:hypothetical protein VTL71DRAFT_13391 [Oculimacula yallundae]|uniref:Uncharacterized protein n=1 Tax=Oculimacula yallundae TaxID=86028 RepID=A0ABR4CKB6_9HELO
MASIPRLLSPRTAAADKPRQVFKFKFETNEQYEAAEKMKDWLERFHDRSMQMAEGFDGFMFFSDGSYELMRLHLPTTDEDELATLRSMWDDIHALTEVYVWEENPHFDFEMPNEKGKDLVKDFDDFVARAKNQKFGGPILGWRPEPEPRLDDEEYWAWQASERKRLGVQEEWEKGFDGEDDD